MAKKKKAPVACQKPIGLEKNSTALAKVEPSREQEQQPISSQKDCAATVPKTTGRPQSGLWTGGSWRGKASPVAAITQTVSTAAAVAVSSASIAAETVQSTLPSASSDRLSRIASVRTLRKSAACAASTTRLSVTANSQDDAERESSKEAVTYKDALPSSVDPPRGGEEPVNADKGKKDMKEERPLPGAGWGGWWTKTNTVVTNVKDDKHGVDILKSESGSAIDVQAKSQDSMTALVNNGILSETQELATGPKAQDESVAGPDVAARVPSEQAEKATAQPQSSWFWLWGYGSGCNTNPADGNDRKASVVEPTASIEAPVPVTVGAFAEVQGPLKDEKPADTSQGSGSWAFWYGGSTTTASSNAGGDSTKESGELAVANTLSQSNPQAAQTDATHLKPDYPKEKSKKISTSPKLTAKSAESKPMPPNGKSKQNSASAVATASGRTTPTGVLTSVPETKGEQISPEKLAQGSAEQNKKTQAQPNLILPSFRSTFKVAETPSYLQQLCSLLGRNTPSQARHLAISPSPPRMHTALAIGVHGYFPAPLIQKVLGPPTGTSIRFANGAATAIEEWTRKHGYACEIEKIALEGEGMIAERVDTLWKLLLNWVDHIRRADFILIACHSQGVPVAAMLMAKLIDLGSIKTSARLSICAMAGINLGPFTSYQTRFLGNSASELFSFASPTSAVSLSYINALSSCLHHHVRIAYIGSIDDQLVSLESSIFTTIDHPYIYRAVFIDGRIHAPDFLTHLVGFALKLRNLGVSDHNLIRELSAPLAGSLYGGEGHSRIYEENGVYNLAVEFALESTTLGVEEMSLNPELRLRKDYEVPSAANTNPYFLPWSLRGVLEEEWVRRECQEETEELRSLFLEWSPITKVLKDVKFRLEAVRSRV